MADGCNKDHNTDAQEIGIDISSICNSNVTNEDHRDDPDNSSESENSLQEEAILPETDHLNLAGLQEFGYTKIYEIEYGFNGNPGTKMAIPTVSMYLERNKKLQHLTYLEYASVIQMEKKKKEKNEDADDGSMDDAKKRGRKSSLRFEYDTRFVMQRLFQQQLAVKQRLPFVIGKAPPKRPGNKPLQLNEESVDAYRKKLDSWLRQADIFARYYLLLFRPTRRDFKRSEFTFEALQKWITDCKISKNWLQRHRLFMFNQRLNGMSISSTSKKVITAYRGRSRKLWNDQERYDNNEYFTSQRVQATRNLEASGLDPEEHNQDNSNLSENVNSNMKRQENDISYIQNALESLSLLTGNDSRCSTITTNQRSIFVSFALSVFSLSTCFNSSSTGCLMVLPQTALLPSIRLDNK
jgi:hypothetical protein